MENEKRLDLIDRSRLLRDPYFQEDRYPESHLLRMAIGNQQTVEAEPVKHGRWEDVKETSLYVSGMKYTVTHTAETCSACKVRIGFVGSKPYLYDSTCPNCGAKMDGGNENA